MKRNHFSKAQGLPPAKPIQRCVAARKDGLPCTNPVADGEITCSRGHHDIPVTRKQLVLGLLYLVRPAFRVLSSSLEDPDPAIRLKAAESILSKAGIGPHLTVHLDDKSADDDLSVLSETELADRAASVLRRLQEARQTSQSALPTLPHPPQEGGDDGK